jgi:hypothetical protein
MSVSVWRARLCVVRVDTSCDKELCSSVVSNLPDVCECDEAIFANGFYENGVVYCSGNYYVGRRERGRE